MSDSFSPTASTGSQTVPNTPRSDNSNKTNLLLDDQNIEISGQAATCASPVSEDVSSSEETCKHRDHNIQPTWPRDIRRRKLNASAYWQSNQELRQILLDIHWNKQDGCALFKLHARLRIEGVPGTPQNSLSRAFIFIDPKIISELLFEEQPTFTPFGQSTVSLTFHLCQSPDLVLPMTYTGFEHESKGLMRSLQSLAQQKCFTIYAELPSRQFSTNYWIQFCKDIATQKLEKDANVADLRNLYQGHGGQVVQDHGLLKAIIDQADTPGLPAYQETDPSITFTRPPKRKRPCDEGSTIRQTAQAVETTAGSDLLEIVNAKLAAHSQTIRHMVECMLSEHEHKLLRLVEDKTEAWGDNVTDMVEKKVAKEMGEVKESIMGEIALFPVQAHFTFPNHPYL